MPLQPKAEKPEAGEVSAKLMRHLLSSIDLSDVPENEPILSPEERATYIATISAAWPHLEKDIKKFLHAQLLFGNQQARDWPQVMFSRGTFNGMDLLFEHWQKAHNEHMTKTPPPEDFDKSNPIGDVT